MKHYLAFLLINLLFITILQAELIIYPAPPEAPRNRDYSVRVREQGGQWQDLDEYDAVANLLDQQHMSFVYFDANFAKPV